MEPHVLVVDDDAAFGETLSVGLRSRGYRVTTATSPVAALDLLEREEIDVVLTDVNMGAVSGIALCERIAETFPDLPVIVLTAFGNLDSAVAAIRAGAYDFLAKPARLDAIGIALRRALERRDLRREIQRLRVESSPASRFGELVGESPAMREVYDLVRRVAGSAASVLITGESGTGKEVIARTIHRESGRRGPFVAVNCAAMPERLLEDELFGHVRGAFGDLEADAAAHAREAREGLFQRAQGGTLLLDEIGELPLGLQPKLLRVLQERAIRPLGGKREIPLDVRIVAATNRDLEAAIDRGPDHPRFREDLYFRINVVQIPLPALRSRVSDVLPLAEHFLRDLAARSAKTIRGIAPAAVDKLLAYPWPGNVRELQNAMERAVALARAEEITVDDLPERVRQFRPSHVVVATDDPSELCTLEEIERRYVLRVLEASGGNKALAARTLGIERKTLYRKLDAWGVPRDVS
jgi:DNA-binding NtrC family response regulator